MENLQALTRQRDDVLAKIREIESSCEGLENEHNAQRVQELNLQQAQLKAQKDAVSAKLADLTAQLSLISQEIASLSGKGIDRILDAIKAQRWYFFKNKTKVLFDRDTGLLWANLNYYNCHKDEEMTYHDTGDDISPIRSLNFDNFSYWRLPTGLEAIKMIDDKTMPFCYGGSEHRVRLQNGCQSEYSMRLSDNGTYGRLYIDGDYPKINSPGGGCCCLWFPCTSAIQPAEYMRDIAPDNPNYTEKERLQFTLDLFVNNDLIPIFNDSELTELYQKIYYEKPKLLAKLEQLQNEIDSSQSVASLSADFDEKALLAKYNMNAIDSSVIQYYGAIQQWTDELLEMLNCYQYEKQDILSQLDEICKAFEQFSDDESCTGFARFADGEFFRKALFLDMEEVKGKIRAFRTQADTIERKIDTIDKGSKAIHELAQLEKEERASFSLIAENTAKIVRNALKKIDFFEVNYEYILEILGTLRQWSDYFQKYEETKKEFINFCYKGKMKKDVINQRIDEWDTFNRMVYENMIAILKRDFVRPIPMVQQDEITIGQKIAAELEVYRNTVNQAYYDRKIKVLDDLIPYAWDFHIVLTQIVSNCAKAGDKLEILQLMDNLFEVIPNQS